MRALALLAACAISLSTGCVSKGKYDASIKDASEARAQLQRVTAEDAARSASEAAARRELQAKLDDETAIHQKLESELAKLGHNADALVAERGTLASALDQSRARLEELRRAQAAAEARARLFHDLAARLKSMVDAGELSIALRDGRMVLQLPNDVLFASGQTDIRAQGQAALKQVAVALKAFPGRHFQVAGHTDDVPIETERFPSNWELSTTRALEVGRFLRGQGVGPAVLSVAGYAEYDPVAANVDARNRARNRRIEITLVPNIDELVAVPDLR
jgi:chemotaxis protein MotB